VVQVEAIGPTAVLRYPQHQLDHLAHNDLSVAREIRTAAFGLIARLQARTLILCHTTAIEKVAAFLVQMTQRRSCDSADVVALPMSRYDIADYLGIAVETVSRGMTQLRGRGVIALHGRRVVKVTDRGALEGLGACGKLFADADTDSTSIDQH
jgi:CRP/FNR family nitrogen fixation transcriptional regulator